MNAAKTALTVMAVAALVLAFVWVGRMTDVSGRSGSATQSLSLAADRAATDLASEADPGKRTQSVGNNIPEGDVAWIPAGAGVGDTGTASGGPQTRAQPTIDPKWLARVSAATGISTRALLAYVTATAAIARENPRCGLSWNTLAGIGYIESRHGTLGGVRVLPNGQVSGGILGPRLDGANVALIRDTDGGKWDGDTEFDRAVGPMQFIPSTWVMYAADATGKGTGDPNNIDDAALAAGHYLCAAGGDLSTGEGWQRAVLAYNHSQSYADSVFRSANAYARAVR